MTVTKVSEKVIDEVCYSLGERLKRARLQSNVTQADLAWHANLSRGAIKNAENQGRCTLDTVVRILMALNMLGELDNFIPEKRISPIEVSDHSKKKVRQRAHSSEPEGSDEGELEW